MGSAPASRRRPVGTAALGWALLALIGPPAGAQEDAVARDCDAQLVARLTGAELAGGWARRHPDSVFARLADPLRRNAWVEILDSLVVRLDDATDAAPSAAMPAGAYGKIRAELDSLAPLLSQLQAVPALRARGDAPAARWQLDGDPDRPRYDLFRASGNRVTVEEATPRGARRAICWTALTVRRLLTFANEPGRLAVVGALERLGTLWNNYGENGHSQLPWELWINGALALRRGVLEPPRYQLVVLHAAPALEVGGAYPDLERADAMLLEIAGLVAYDGDRTSFVAASTFATVTAGRRVGWGPMIHVGRAFKLGYAFRRRDGAGGRRNGLVVSADLFGFLLDAPRIVRVRASEALQKKLSCLVPGSAGRPPSC